MSKKGSFTGVVVSAALIYAGFNADKLPMFADAEAAPTTTSPPVEVFDTPDGSTPLPVENTVVVDKNSFDYNEVFIASNGYAWPVGRPHKVLYGTQIDLPCDISNCHHDQSGAIDISYADAGAHNPLRPENAAGVVGEDSIVGEPVRAIIGGTIEVSALGNDSPDYCQRIQLHGADGEFYWYGHLENAISPNGTEVAVLTGQQIATVGRFACAPQSVRSAAHGHVDQGCHEIVNGVDTPQRGGNADCRNPNFVDTINLIWAELPG